MGTKNWQLTHQLKLAQKAGRTEEVTQLSALLEASQAECKHPKVSYQVSVCREDMMTKNRGLIHKGDEIVQCLDCGYIIRHRIKNA
jgi:hypothetical protein